jgi:hypothetical protein
MWGLMTRPGVAKQAADEPKTEEDAKSESGILDAYQVTTYPTFILIGPDDKIIANDIGFSGEDQLRQMIDNAGPVSKK